VGRQDKKGLGIGGKRARKVGKTFFYRLDTRHKELKKTGWGSKALEKRISRRRRKGKRRRVKRINKNFSQIDAESSRTKL